jgi:hypothetical protein
MLNNLFPIKVQYEKSGEFVHENISEIKGGERYVVMRFNACPLCYDDGWTMTEDGPIVCRCKKKMTWELLLSVSHRACKEARSYKGDIEIRAVKAWVEEHFICVDVQYHSYGYCALYEYNMKNDILVLAQD